MPIDDFGKKGVRARPAPKDVAQRIVTSLPVRGSLPIRPVNDDPKAKADTNKGDRIVVTTPPAGVRPARQLPPERRTGAATRKPGVALDNELRRTRINNGRAPLSTTDADSGDIKVKNTGAVTRPLPPATRTRVERRVDTRKSVGDDDDGAPPAGRPVRRSTPTAKEEERSPSPKVNERPERERSRPATRRIDESRDESPPVERRREERPPVERRSQPHRPDPPKERPSPPAERERPAARERNPAPREESKQSPPPPSEPARERNAPPRHGKTSEP
jgi:hypothetical protein